MHCPVEKQQKMRRGVGIVSDPDSLGRHASCHGKVKPLTITWRSARQAWVAGVAHGGVPARQRRPRTLAML